MTHREGVALSFGRRVVLCSAASLAIGLPLGFGILDAMQAPTQLVHATSGSVPAFDVVSIKPNHDSGPRRMIGISPTGFTAKRASLRDLIGIAYGVKGDDQVTGGPGWLNSEYYDVEAKESEADIEAAKNLPMDQRRTQLSLMLQSMLADRFALKTTIETRDLPVYALVVAKGGPKIREVQVDPFPPPGTTPPPGAHLPRLMTTDRRVWTASAFPMGEFTNFLSHFEELGSRLVEDETALKGNYDFVLSGVSMGPMEGNHETPSEPVTSIFTALQEQLGLKLESRKAPVEVLVIERADHPSSN
jgi:uncharacterized protein (TIGR03435 family)